MNIKTLLALACAVSISAITSLATAQEAAPNVPKSVKVSPEQKAAERGAKKAEGTAAQAKGDMNPMEAPSDKKAKAAGTHESRSAERKERRKANAEAAKKGEIKGTNEAGPK